jgi:hypothetical protein
MRVLTKEQIFPQQENWILEEYETEFFRCTPTELYLAPYWDLPDRSFVTVRWYERPNEDNLLNTLTEALEGAYDYD